MSDSKIAKQPEKKKANKNVANRVASGFKNLGKRLTNFFVSMKAEVKRVMWPDRKRLIQSTATVLVIALSPVCFCSPSTLCSAKPWKPSASTHRFRRLSPQRLLRRLPLQPKRLPPQPRRQRPRQPQLQPQQQPPPRTDLQFEARL